MIELEDVFRMEWGRILSALISVLGDFDLAEEALQEAFSCAVAEWATETPRNPRAWLYTTARHKAIDTIRRRANFAEKQTELVVLEELRTIGAAKIEEDSTVPDERLRLIFTCCHPALPPEAQVALTLRTLCGLTTEEIAHAFLLPTPTIAQRLVRAKTKIRKAAIPYRVPLAPDVPERLSVVMAVVYLVFNEGYAAAHGDALVRHELCTEAIRLTRLLRALLQAPYPELELWYNRHFRPARSDRMQLRPPSPLYMQKPPVQRRRIGARSVPFTAGCSLCTGRRWLRSITLSLCRWQKVRKQLYHWLRLSSRRSKTTIFGMPRGPIFCGGLVERPRRFAVISARSSSRKMKSREGS